jgi:hypothetical protein
LICLENINPSVILSRIQERADENINNPSVRDPVSIPESRSL